MLCIVYNKSRKFPAKHKLMHFFFRSSSFINSHILLIFTMPTQVKNDIVKTFYFSYSTSHFFVTMNPPDLYENQVPQVTTVSVSHIALVK